MTVIATSPNGQLRLRQFKNGNVVVELLSHGEWNWCVYKTNPLERGQQIYDSQVKFHQK